MLVNQLVALPTPETTAYLRAVFSGCFFEINWGGLYVEINTSAHEMTAKPGNEYVAYAGVLGQIYDSNIGHTNLVLSLISEDLPKRHQEVQGQAPTILPGYYPHIVLVERFATPHRRQSRGLLNSYSDILASSSHPLVFSSEMEVERDSSTVNVMDILAHV